MPLLKEPKYYLIDLCFSDTAGLFNQLWGLVNGIMIGHYTKRDIVVRGLYPQYDKRDTISISKVIDLDRLNKSLVKLGIKTVVHNKKSLSNIDWKKSSLFNPGLRSIRYPMFIPIVNLLLLETHVYTDLGSTCFYPLGNYPDHIQGMVRSIFRVLPFTDKIYSVVNECISILGLKTETGYSSVHLRMEDDMLKMFDECHKINPEEYTKKYMEKYWVFMEELFGKNDDIYLATHLCRSENKNNHLPSLIKERYPNVRFWEGKDTWRRHYPNFIQGREIDALIDYLMCTKSRKFVGFIPSTFSWAVSNHFHNDHRIVRVIEH